MFIVPQEYKCVNCEYEFEFSPHVPHTAPVTSMGKPACPKCYDKFLQSIGLGYATYAWDGPSDYEKAVKIKDWVKD